MRLTRAEGDSDPTVQGSGTAAPEVPRGESGPLCSPPALTRFHCKAHGLSPAVSSARFLLTRQVQNLHYTPSQDLRDLVIWWAFPRRQSSGRTMPPPHTHMKALDEIIMGFLMVSSGKESVGNVYSFLFGT